MTPQQPGASGGAGSRPPPGAPTPGGHTPGGHTPGAQAGRAVQPQIPGYELLEELGRGAHGAVLRARELQTGRQVALKLLLGSRLEPTHAERFRREGELAARLDHPGIVRVHGGGLLPGGVPYLVYELVEGGTLADALPTLGRAERLGLLLQACRAVGHAHARGVVHRDLKPQNMLVDATGALRVTDLGVGAGAGLTRLTATGALLGTPSHAAPEQLSGDRARIGPPSDVWSLGVILYQLLTNELPFVADSYVALMGELLRPPPAPRRLDPTISRAVEAVCLRALSPDPAARPATGDALADALEAALAAPPPPPPWRRPGVLAAGAAGLLVAGALAAWSLRPRAVTPPQPPPVTEVAPVATAIAPPAPGLPPELRALGERAAAGEPAAMLELGRVLHRGVGVPRDRDAGRVWLRRAARAGELEAVRRLLDDPLTPRQTVAELRTVLERLARGEPPPALVLWARALTDARGGRRDPARAVELLRRASQRGHVPASAPLALLLATGDGATQDQGAAIELLEQAAAQGDVVAQRELGRFYLEGEVAPRSETRANDLLARAVAQGDAQAMVLLARDGPDGDRLLEQAAAAGDTLAMVLLAGGDLGRRLEWLRRAADEGEVRAMYQLWLILGEGTPKEHAEGLAFYRQAAGLDDELCGALANELYRGEGRLAVDKGESLKWFGELALRGAHEWIHGAATTAEVMDPAWAMALYSLLPDDPRSLYRRAALVEEGRGAPKAYARSSALWRRAAELGDPSALLAVGDRLRTGDLGFERDPVGALRAWEACAEATGADAVETVALASSRIAGHLLEGDPAVRDPVKGRRWALLAAARGAASGKYLAGRCHLEGLGGAVDVQEGLGLLQRAVDDDDNGALVYLAGLLRRGEHVAKDPTRARTLLRRAAERGVFSCFLDYAAMLEEGEGGPVDAVSAEHWRDRAKASAGR